MRSLVRNFPIVMFLEIDKSWTLFLDRDGVINEKRENDYVKKWDEFVFIDGSLEAISILSNLFHHIIIVTNQRGVGKELMTEADLNFIHKQMIGVINKNMGRIDEIYFCTDIDDFAINRKPNIGMALKAKLDFPEIDFRKSTMIGDSESDMIFAQRLEMKGVLIGSFNENDLVKSAADFTFDSLLSIARHLENFKIKI